jgi:uncharacterized protein YjbI with pentapeptide repeats
MAEKSQLTATSIVAGHGATVISPLYHYYFLSFFGHTGGLRKGAEMTPQEINAVLLNHENWVRNEPGGKRANLALQNLYGLPLSGANLAQIKLTGADFSGSNLKGADMSGAVLTGAKLAGCRIDGANLEGARLEDTVVAGN